MPVAFLVLLVTSSVGRAGSQSDLPALEHALIVAARSIQQQTPQSTLRIRLSSGDRFTIPSTDVHDAATQIVRSAASRQAHPPVQPDHVLVLHVRQVTPDRDAHVRVILSSGAAIRMRSTDAYDARLTFLRTELLQAISSANAAVLDRARSQSPQALAPSTPSVQFDTKGADFHDWLRRFIAQVRREWIVPMTAMNVRAHARVSFNVGRDGRITDVTLAESSGVESADKAVLAAINAANPTYPLPPDYPDAQLLLTITFYYNESPGGQRN